MKLQRPKPTKKINKNGKARKARASGWWTNSKEADSNRLYRVCRCGILVLKNMGKITNPWSWFGQHIKRCEKKNWKFLEKVFCIKLLFTLIFGKELKHGQRFRNLHSMKMFLGCTTADVPDKSVADDSMASDVSMKAPLKVYIF